MDGSQCDTCRKFVANVPPNWLLVQQSTGSNGGLFGMVPTVETMGTFCTWKCLVEFAYVLLATEQESA